MRGWHGVDPELDGSLRRSLVVYGRRGYHHSQLMTPDLYALTTPAQRAGFYAFRTRHPRVPVAWLRSGDGRVWWITAAELDRRSRLLSWARSRERGLRGTVRELSRRLGVAPSTVTRTLRALERIGAILLETRRGRYGGVRVRVLDPSPTSSPPLGRRPTKVATLSRATTWRDPAELQDGDVYVPRALPPGPTPDQVRDVPPDPRILEVLEARDRDPWWQELRAQVARYRAGVNAVVPW